jgi:spermidine synthase
LWSKQFKDFSSSLLALVSKVPGSFFLALIGAVFIVGALLQKRLPAIWGPRAVLVAVGTTGFAEIAIEVITLLGFQAIHGYVYHKIAIIITAFMLGLALGAALIRPIASSGRRKTHLFLLIQGLVCLYPLLLLGVLIFMSGGGAQSTGSGGGFQANFIFPALAFAAGFVGGMQFPLANALWLSEVSGTARAAGFTYGTDLVGSCVGAFLTTAFLVPIYGIPFACITASILNVGALLLLVCKFIPLRLR